MPTSTESEYIYRVRNPYIEIPQSTEMALKISGFHGNFSRKWLVFFGVFWVVTVIFRCKIRIFQHWQQPFYDFTNSPVFATYWPQLILQVHTHAHTHARTNQNATDSRTKQVPRTTYRIPTALTTHTLPQDPDRHVDEGKNWHTRANSCSEHNRERCYGEMRILSW